MSEFELNLLRHRSVESIRQKARRGELQYWLPVGYLWTIDGKVEIGLRVSHDECPDERSRRQSTKDRRTKKPRREWTVLIQDHHSGYISWEQYERRQAMVAANTHMKSRMQPQAGRGGKALLAGCYAAVGAGECCTCPIQVDEASCLRYQYKGGAD